MKMSLSIDNKGCYKKRISIKLFIKGVLLIILLLNIKCNKEDRKSCWQAFFTSGSDVSGLIVCDVTKAEAEEKHPGYWFYPAGDAKYCWKATKPGDPTYPQYLWGVPTAMKANLETTWGYTLFKIECNSFCNLRWIEKHKSKITGFFGPSLNKFETLVNADSCSRLLIGQVVVYRETTDSIITRELVDKKP